MQPREVLQQATQLLEREDAWTKGTLRRETEDGEVVGMCAWGAVLTAIDTALIGYVPYREVADLETETCRVLADAMCDLFSERLPAETGAVGPVASGSVIALVNDHLDTTHEDVLLAFKHAVGACDDR